MKSKALVGLLCHKLSPTTIYDCCMDVHVKIVRFTPENINWSEKKIKGQVLEKGKWIDAETPFPGAVYNRLYSDSISIGCKLEMAIGKRKVFNHCTLFDKHVIFRALNNSEIKEFLIPTYGYSPDVLLSILKKTGSVLIKPAKGSMASDVYKITVANGNFFVYLRTMLSPKVFSNNDEFIDFVNRLTNSRKFIIQPFIDFIRINGHIFDMRLLVQKNGRGMWDITADISRVGYKESFVTNYVFTLKSIKEALMGTKYERHLLPQLKNIAIDAAKILDKRLCHIGEISIDFSIGTDEKLYIIEINGKPDKLIYKDFNLEAFYKAVKTPIYYASHLIKY